MVLGKKNEKVSSHHYRYFVVVIGDG